MAEATSVNSMKRVSRACLHCRARKSRCDLDTGGLPPCIRCRKDGRECVLGGSNRGGSRIRKKHRHASVSSTATSPPRTNDAPHTPRSSYEGTRPPCNDAHAYQTPGSDHVSSVAAVDTALSTAIPRNPSDAWQLLKDVATGAPGDVHSGARLRVPGRPQDGGSSPHNTLGSSSTNGGSGGGILSYRLVREGYLAATVVSSLVARFAEHYHPYLPLVPRKYFDPSALDAFAANDKHLLTAVLTIASKDFLEESTVHLCCSRYMHDLISGVAAGHDCEVEAVEALLLLAEWEPQGLRDQVETVGRGEEDRAAWMHVGMALRTGYFLGLDRTAFRGEAAEEARNDGRKRLAWASCYVSDRLISVRIGKAFWSRGPGPMTGLSSQDFPSLQPARPGDEDYARIFQATLALTQLYSNVHDVLYSGMRTSGQMMLMGDYVKYVDEFRSAIAHWNRIWGGLICSQHIKVTLQMSYDYLRLYTNAFAFQAAISQSISRRSKGDASSLQDHLRDVFSDVGSMPDARFIYESVAAAKSYLTTLTSYVDPEKHLRYMPLRFYLYAIYSAVFLYKARSYGVMTGSEEQSVREMIYQTMDVLRRASVSHQDAGARYARLLDLLWHRDRSSRSLSEQGASTGDGPVSSAGQQQPSTSASTSTANSLTVDQAGGSGSGNGNDYHTQQYSPANDFSWLDLEAVGDYVINDHGHLNGASLFAPITMTTFPTAAHPHQHQQQQSIIGPALPNVNVNGGGDGGGGGAGPQWSNPQQQQQQQPGPGAYHWQFDLHGNLLF